MTNFIIKYTNILWGFPTKGDCSIIKSAALYNVLVQIYNAILIVVPILVVTLCTIDIARAVIAQDDKDMKAAGAKAIKRVIIGVAMMFLPLIVDTILKLAGVGSGVCELGFN